MIQRSWQQFQTPVRQSEQRNPAQSGRKQVSTSTMGSCEFAAGLVCTAFGLACGGLFLSGNGAIFFSKSFAC